MFLKDEAKISQNKAHKELKRPRRNIMEILLTFLAITLPSTLAIELVGNPPQNLTNIYQTKWFRQRVIIIFSRNPNDFLHGRWCLLWNDDFFYLSRLTTSVSLKMDISSRNIWSMTLIGTKPGAVQFFSTPETKAILKPLLRTLALFLTRRQCSALS